MLASRRGENCPSPNCLLVCVPLCCRRLIYWLCLSLQSSIRGFGFSFSFVPVVVMLGVNLYYVCSSAGQGAVFDIQPPPTEAPPKQRWFGWTVRRWDKNCKLWEQIWLCLTVSFYISQCTWKYTVCSYWLQKSCLPSSLQLWYLCFIQWKIPESCSYRCKMIFKGTVFGKVGGKVLQIYLVI